MSKFGLSNDEILKRTLKYILVFIISAFSIKYIPKSDLICWQDIFIISTIIVCVMVSLELYIPTLKINKPEEQIEETYE